MISNLADLLTRRTNKEMCMRYTQMVEEMLWMIDVRRVDFNTGILDKQRTMDGYKFLVLWGGGSTDWIPLKGMNMSCFLGNS